MNNFGKLLVNTTPERYALMQVKNQTKLACYINGEWIIDATCKSINDMLEMGLVCEESVNGWIETKANQDLH